MYKWRAGRSCVYKNYVHLVFVTKYRRDVFTVEMLSSTKMVIKETCEQMECELLEFGGIPANPEYSHRSHFCISLY